MLQSAYASDSASSLYSASLLSFNSDYCNAGELSDALTERSLSINNLSFDDSVENASMNVVCSLDSSRALDAISESTLSVDSVENVSMCVVCNTPENVESEDILNQVGGGNNHERFVLVSRGVTNSKRFGASGQNLVLRITEPSINSNPIIWLREAITDIHGYILAEEPSLMDYITITVKSDDFNRGPGWMSLRYVKDFKPDDLFNVIFSITQSNVDFNLKNNVILDTIILKGVFGAGKRNLSTTSAINKRSIISIRNDDNLCLPRAIAVGLLHLSIEKNPESNQDALWKKIIDSRRNPQKQAAVELLKKINMTPKDIPKDGCSLEHIDKFQNILCDDKIAIVVYSNTNFGSNTEILYDGRNIEKLIDQNDIQQLSLLHFENPQPHFSYIKSLKQAGGSVNFCNVCNKSYEWKDAHLCNATCTSCFSRPACKKSENEITCLECKRTFVNDSCYKIHLQNDSYSRNSSVCSVIKKCPICKKQINNKKTKHEHKCNTFYCNRCQITHEYNEMCYIKPILSEKSVTKNKPENRFIFYDFETTQDTSYNESSNLHKVNLCVAQQVCDICIDNENLQNCCIYCGTREFVFFTDPVKNFLELAIRNNSTFNQTICIAHNAKAFDTHFIVREVLKLNLNPKIILNGRNIILLSVNQTRFIDSINYFQMKLSALPKAFGLCENTVKGYFPHLFNTSLNKNYKGKKPEPFYYAPDSMSEKERALFYKWYNANKNSTFCLQKEIEKYCKMDVTILRQTCTVFRTIFIKIGDTCPFSEATTIASACSRLFRKNFLQQTTIALIPAKGYRLADNHSKKSLEWLLWREHQLGREIIHAARGREHVIFQKLRVDGFLPSHTDSSSKGTVFEFQGCYTHGCKKCFKINYENRFSFDRPMTVCFDETLKKIEHIRKLAYDVEEMWECQFDELKKKNLELRNFLKDHPRLSAVKLNPRDAFFGGRTENFVTSYKIKANEKIKYTDICSLYPYICKNGKFPLGHPKIYVNSECLLFTGKKFENFDKVNGLVKCTILPPQNLYIPVLPVKMKGKLLFPLCRSCCENEELDDCTHENELDRALSGTWVSEELKVALKKGYKIIEIFVIWQYTLTQIDGEGKGGLFGDYINTFLKIKQEASGWPSECIEAETKKKEYIEQYALKERVLLDYNKIEYNSGLRSVAKLCLNSFWGKFGQRDNLPQTEFISSRDHLFRLISNKSKIINNMILIDEQNLCVNWEYVDDAVKQSNYTNVVIAAFVTAQARLALYNYLEKLDRRVLYCDTDSCIFITNENATSQYEPELGNFLGQMTDELTKYGENAYITHFISGGPKFYGYRGISDKGTFETCKIKGIRLNYENSKHINFDSIDKLLKKEIESIELTFRNIKRTPHFNIITTEQKKTCSIVLTKRRYYQSGNSLPFGYK